MTYTIYLYHFYVVEAVLHFTSHWIAPVHALWVDTGIQFLFALLPVLLVSAMIYLTLERPFVTLSHQVTRRLRASRNPPISPA
jgi:peptidoglycan/LPS O-acetylase OafA/YrhL